MSDEKLPQVVTTAPERIWLQVSDCDGDEEEPFPHGVDAEITWCQDSVMAVEVEYVRADLAHPAPAYITDEMVDAACEAHLLAWADCEQSGYVYNATDIDDDVRACIRAALRAAMGAGVLPRGETK